MYCHQCGKKVLEGSRFCSHCGAQIQQPPEENLDANIDEAAVLGKKEVNDISEAAEEGSDSELNQNTIQTDSNICESTEETIAATIEEQPEKPTSSSHRQESKLHVILRLLPILLPIISLILVTAGLGYYYFQEKEINKEVLALKEKAEDTALKEDYGKAKELLEKALEKRPNYSALKADLKIIEKALNFEKSISQISQAIKETQFDAASKELESMKGQLNKEKNPFFEPFQNLIKEKEIQITVGTIKKELNKLTTVEQLGSKLSILSSLPEEEAGEVKKEILNKIVQITSDEAEKELNNKQFSSAISIIDEGLQYAVNDKKLLALKSRVEQDKKSFEQAEQQRIEKAMEAAAKEDLKNQTAAVEVSDCSVTVDEYGDMYMMGTVKNVATTKISSISISYSFYGTNNEYLGNGYTSVYPYSLNPGESGNFEDVYFGVYQDVRVEIDNITWYLE